MRRAASGASARSSSGSTTSVSGPRRSSSRSNQASPADEDLPDRSGTLVGPGRSGRDGLEQPGHRRVGGDPHPSAVRPRDERPERTDPPGTPSVRCRQVRQRVGQHLGRRRSGGRGRADPVDPEAPHAVGHLAPGVHVPVPLGGEEPPRSDGAFAGLIGRGRVVGDRQPIVRTRGRRGPSRAGPGCRAPPRWRSARGPGRAWPGPGTARRPRRFPGTASSARAEAARPRPSRGLSRRGRARVVPTRVDTESSVTTISRSWSGV